MTMKFWESDFFNYGLLTDHILTQYSGKAESSYPDDILSKMEQAYTWKIALPGVKKENLKIEAISNILYVCVKDPETLPEHLFIRKANHSIKLPKDCLIDKITATMTDGVLTITIPRQELTVNNRVITIQEVNQSAPAQPQQEQVPALT